jgi:hypothetical protein
VAQRFQEAVKTCCRGHLSKLARSTNVAEAVSKSSSSRNAVIPMFHSLLRGR